jgi:hypothetical protein
MQEIRTEFLFAIAIEVAKPVVLGPGPLGTRINVTVNSGTFEGPRLKGIVLPGGSDWIVLRGDNAMQLDVRLPLQTDDGAVINMVYRGIRHGPKEVIDRLNRGEDVDPRSTISALHRSSRPARRNTAGSTASSPSPPASAPRPAPSTTSSRCCDPLTACFPLSRTHEALSRSRERGRVRAQGSLRPSEAVTEHRRQPSP